MSHELRTPLNAIAGYAELMELGLHGPVSDEQRNALTRIQQSQRHLLGLINEVLNYARVDAGAVRYEIEMIEVADAFQAAAALVRPQADARQIALTIEELPAALLVRADREKTQQILLNLLSNAIKFTDAGGSIRMRAAPTDGDVVLEVQDTGIGIPPNKLPQIFEPFVQVDQRLTRRQEGVGLGLAISRDLARGMKGDLTVRSAEGEGSVFLLRLPGVRDER